MSASPYEHLVGRKLPGASYTLPEYLTWLWQDTCLVPQTRDVAHPSLGYFIGMQGVGMSIQEMFDMMEATADSGVMFGETELEFFAPIRLGATFAVEAEVVAVERKEGKRAGVFDKFSFTMRCRDEETGEPVCTCTNTWVFPRKEA
jgi:acyl dehydratase